MNPIEELSKITESLKAVASTGDAAEVANPLSAIKESATNIGRSFSGSWLGYHSKVYYAGFAPPPPGAHFSQEWGLQDVSYTSLGSRGDWREVDPVDVKTRIEKDAGNANLIAAKAASKQALEDLASAKLEILSIFETSLAAAPDNFLERLKADLEKIEVMSGHEIARAWVPKGQMITRDMMALGQGNKVPPHVQDLADAASINQCFEACKATASICERAVSHLERKSKKSRRPGTPGSNVFIGHGRSLAWRELKDFVKDRLGLPWDEFNRVPVAGITNTSRLSAMLDDAAIAFLVMTAEDALEDGDVQARLNVVHEAGLFQGRLGFTKAIILIEDECKGFSNIEGLGHLPLLAFFSHAICRFRCSLATISGIYGHLPGERQDGQRLEVSCPTIEIADTIAFYLVTPIWAIDGDRPMIRGDLSNRVIHLTSRETSAESPVLQDRVAITKFLSILYGRHLNGGIRNIRGGYRCVCFSEAPITVLARMLADRESRYAPLGVMVDKLWLFAQGGRPVIYQPEAEYEILPEALRYRHVRYEPDRGNDFSWEREWRLHADRLALNPAETTLVAPSRAIVDSLKAEHLENQRMAVYDLGEDAAYALQAFEWHFLVLDDLGLDVDFG